MLPPKMEFTNPDGLNKNLVPSPMDNVGINIGRVNNSTNHFFPFILERDKKYAAIVARIVAKTAPTSE